MAGNVLALRSSEDAPGWLLPPRLSPSGLWERNWKPLAEIMLLWQLDQSVTADRQATEGRQGGGNSNRHLYCRRAKLRAMNTTECLGGAQVLFWQQTVTAWVLWGLLLQGLWLLIDIWLWPFFLAFLKHDGIFFGSASSSFHRPCRKRLAHLPLQRFP